jgi:aminoglycoside phosphotransferase (APT) family kinase protein
MLFVADDRRRAWREWVALDRMRRAGPRLAPEPVAYLPDGPLPQPVVVYRWTEGAALTGQITSVQDLSELVLALRTIHRAPDLPDIEPMIAYHQPPDYAGYLAEIRENVDRVQAWARRQESEAGPRPDWAADLPLLAPVIGETATLAEQLVCASGMSGAYPTPALIRVDGNLDNILRDACRRLTFVDWEYSGAGDPACDLAELRWHPGASHLPDEWWDVALDDYPPLPGDVEFQKRLALYNRLLPIWWVGRSALYLLEGAGHMPARPRLTPIPAHVLGDVRARIDVLLAFLGLS